MERPACSNANTPAVIPRAAPPRPKLGRGRRILLRYCTKWLNLVCQDSEELSPELTERYPRATAGGNNWTAKVRDPRTLWNFVEVQISVFLAPSIYPWAKFRGSKFCFVSLCPILLIWNSFSAPLHSASEQFWGRRTTGLCWTWNWNQNCRRRCSSSG